MSNHRTQAASPKIIIHQSELDRIAGWAAASPRIETGGDLFGYRTHSGVPIVTVAIGPGPAAKHNPTSFYQDTDFLRRVGTALNQSHGLQYIGEWHSHHLMGLARPSGGDSATVASILENQPLADFFLCIVNLREEGGLLGRPSLKMTAGAFHFVRGRKEPATASWVVLEEDSPIAAQVYADRALGLKSSEPKRIWTVPRTTLDAPSASSQPDPLGGLMNSDGGKAFFPQLFSKLSEAYGKTDMRVLADGAVTVGFASGAQAFVLKMPNGFPEFPATVTATDGHMQWTRPLPSAAGLKPLPFFQSIKDHVAAGPPVAVRDAALQPVNVVPARRDPREARSSTDLLVIAVAVLTAVIVGAFVWMALDSQDMAQRQQRLTTTVEDLRNQISGLPVAIAKRDEALLAEVARLRRAVEANQTETAGIPDRLKPQLASLDERHNGLSHTVDGLASRLDKLPAAPTVDLTPFTSEIAALKQGIAAVKQDIAIEQARSAAVASNAQAALDNVAREQKSLSDSVSRRLDNLPAAIATELAPVRAELVELKEGLAAVRAENVALKEGLAAVRTENAAMKDGLAAVRTESAALPDRLAPLSTVVQGLGGLQSRVKAMEDRVAAMQSRLRRMRR
jgi:predicted nuclease with TOPRIM domain